AHGHAMTQEAINALMIRAARRGKRVVRLKGGDPFVFGRGGEEALALRAAGVPFDVVPGVTTAVAAPALAGIPVSHRGLASAFLVVSGHDEQVFASAVGALQPGGVPLVVLMGLGRADAIADRLIDRGWSPSTPAAVVTDASTERQQAWTGRLDALGAAASALDTDGPGTIVIGAVAALQCVSNSSSDTARRGRADEESVDAARPLQVTRERYGASASGAGVGPRAGKEYVSSR